MEAKPLIVKNTYSATIDKVWNAITNKDQMKAWYFDLKEFKPQKGFKFQFTGENPDYAGQSVVTFELSKESETKTNITLTHDGLDSFPKDDPNFSLASFTAGWNFILGESLKKYLENS